MASNMKAVKLRIKSVQSTMQITKAMELVASSKLRKAKERAEVCRPYFTELHETLKEIARENTDFSSVYAKESSNNKTCYVVIAGDRGLAGGYNTNLFKCLEASAEGLYGSAGWKESSGISPSERDRSSDRTVCRGRKYFCSGLF